MNLLPLFIFWCLWFLNYSTRSSLSPILPLVEESLSLSHGQAGGFYTSMALGFGLSMLLTGRFASRLGYKRTVVTGSIGVGLVYIFIQWADHYTALHILFFLLGLASGTYMPAILPIITETYDPRHWGKAIGFHDSAASLSIFAIPLLAAFGLQFVSWRGLLLILGITALILPIFFWQVSSEPKRERSPIQGNFVGLFKKRNVWVMGILSIFASGASIGVFGILPLYLIKERGIDFGYANTLLGISRIGGIFVSILVGYLTDHVGYRKMIMGSLFLTGLSTIGLSLASSLPLILTALILQALLAISYFPACFAAISNLTSLSERAMFTGVILSIGVIFGMGSTPFLLGVTADHFSFKVGIFGLGILVTLSSFLVLLLEERLPMAGVDRSAANG
jgi:NNP family nitrate/nitrite transporter-like MFS transporter